MTKAEEHPVMNTKAAAYEMYTRKTCPNCPPVKAFMANVEIAGRNIDVDTEEGLAEAASKGVFAAPTVIFYNEAGVETARCHNVEELEAVFNKVAVTA
jgi:ribonucleoside-triphosphate reductase